MAKIAWLGLGVMGYPMAGHLANSGHQLTVFNRSTARAESWVHKYEGHLATTVLEAVKDADFVFACVGNDEDVRSITTGKKGAFAGMKSGAIFIDCTTASANLARELSTEAETRGFDFLDSPVSGGQVGAEEGTLTVMVGGDIEPFQKAEPIIMCFAKVVKLIGSSGSGQTAKMVNQLCIAGVVQGLSEGINLAKRAGLDIQKVMETISAGAAGSWQMTNRWKTMNEGRYDFGFAVDLMRKDLSIAIAEAKNIGAPVQLAELVDQFYNEVQRMGGGRWDTSSLLVRLADESISK